MRETLPKDKPGNKGARSADERMDVRAELDRLEAQLAELKIQYEQYFTGILALPPDKLHNLVKRQMRELLRAPFKNSAMNYRLRTLEGRYHTFHTYWQRVLRQREEGNYSKDVFKASMRERAALEEAKSETKVGAAERKMETLYNTYRNTLEKQTGKTHNIDYETFEQSLLQRADDFKRNNKGERLTFKVVVEDGKVSVRIAAKK